MTGVQHDTASRTNVEKRLMGEFLRYRISLRIKHRQCALDSSLSIAVEHNLAG